MKVKHHHCYESFIFNNSTEPSFDFETKVYTTPLQYWTLLHNQYLMDQEAKSQKKGISTNHKELDFKLRTNRIEDHQPEKERHSKH